VIVIKERSETGTEAWSGSSVLSARSVTAGYGSVPVIKDVSIEVEPGQIVALLGPNGAGKTTTLSALCGDLGTTSGSIIWKGERARSTSYDRARAGLAYVMEDRSIIRGLSVGDNLRLGRGPIDRALAVFPELKPLMRRKAGVLSGGEQQMLALGRALARGPDLLMVDELSLGLAPIIVDRLLIALTEAAAEGTAVLLVEQHVRKALKYADRVYVLRRGEVALAADAAEIRGRHTIIEDLYLSDRPEAGDIVSG
jgi:ABC-type branched-subunit amino acid transport system ATPase component